MKLTVLILFLACFIGLAILLWDRNVNESQSQVPNARNTSLAEPTRTGSNPMNLADSESKNNLPSPASPTSIDDLWMEVMNVPSDRQLIMTEFHKLGGVIKDEALEKEIAAIVREQFKDDRSAFVASLKSKGLTLEEFRIQRHDQLVVYVMKERITQGITDPILKKKKVDEWLRRLMKSASPSTGDSETD